MQIGVLFGGLALLFVLGTGFDHGRQGALGATGPEQCRLEPAVTSAGAEKLHDWERYGDYGLCLFREGRYVTADAAFGKAESLMPRSDRQLYEVGAFPVIIWSGASLLAAHQTPAAVARFRRVAAFYDHASQSVITPESYRRPADQLFRSGRYRAAFQAYRSAYFEHGNLKLYDAQFWGTPAEATFERALSMAELGHYAQADALVAGVLLAQPDFTDARFIAALLHYVRADPLDGQRELLQVATTRFFRSATQPRNPAALQLSAIRMLDHESSRAQAGHRRI